MPMPISTRMPAPRQNQPRKRTARLMRSTTTPSLPPSSPISKAVTLGKRVASAAISPAPRPSAGSGIAAIQVCGASAKAYGLSKMKKFGRRLSQRTARMLVTVAWSCTPWMSRVSTSPRRAPTLLAKRFSNDASTCSPVAGIQRPATMVSSGPSSARQLRRCSRPRMNRSRWASWVPPSTFWGSLPLMLLSRAITIGLSNGSTPHCCRTTRANSST